MGKLPKRPSSGQFGAVIGPRTTVAHPGIVETRFRGRITRADIDMAFRCLRSHAVDVWVVDTLEADGYEPAAVTVASEQMRGAVTWGLRAVVVISTSDAIRMAVSVIAFASGAPFQVVQTAAEAFEAARRIQKGER
jgi:hypothetical protein